MDTIDFTNIEDHAQTLYGDGKAELLLRIWNQIPENDRICFPKLAFRVAQIHSDEGRHDEARLILKLCQRFCEEAKYTVGLGSIFLEHARIACQENNLEQVQYFIKRVHEVSTLNVHLGEGENTLGKAFQDIDPMQALVHFEKARSFFIKAQIDIPECEADVARASFRAGRLAMQLRLFDKGWRYLREAETYARSLKDPKLLSKVLVRKGEAYVNQGEYVTAHECFQEAVQLSLSSPHQQIEAKSHLSALLVLMDDQRAAQKFLSQINYLGHTDTMVHRLLTETWIDIFDMKLTTAKQLLKRVASLQGESAVVKHRLSLLQGFIAAQDSSISELVLMHLEDSASFFEDNNILIEASQGRLILAWCYMLIAKPLHAKVQIEALEALIELIGHAKHLYRLYSLCAPLIGGWLSVSIRTTIEQSFVEIPSDNANPQIRIYAFGVPRLFVGTNEYPQSDTSSFIGIKLLLFMLEKRQASIEEVIDAIWPNLTMENGRQRFYQTTTNLKRRQALDEWYTYDSVNKLYKVKKQFPHYYDADDFNQTYEQFKRSQNPPQQYALGWKLLNLYDVFAHGVNEEAFEVMRLDYEARYDLILIKLKELSPDIMQILPKDWYVDLDHKINFIQADKSTPHF